MGCLSLHLPDRRGFGQTQKKLLCRYSDLEALEEAMESLMGVVGGNERERTNTFKRVKNIWTRAHHALSVNAWMVNVNQNE